MTSIFWPRVFKDDKREKTSTTCMLLRRAMMDALGRKIELIRFDQNNQTPPGGATWERRIHPQSAFTPTQAAVSQTSSESPETNQSLLNVSYANT